MQVRYQAALRPERGNSTPANAALSLKLVEDGAQFALDCCDIDTGRGRNRTGETAVAHHCRGLGLVVVREGAVETVARAADGEAFFVEQLANAADQQHFVVLVIAPVAAALYRLQLRELLLPVAKHVRLHPAEVAHFTDGEVALGGDRRQLSFPAAWLHGAPFQPSPSASGWRGM